MGKTWSSGLAPCAESGAPGQRKARGGSFFGSSQKVDGSGEHGSHSIMRNSPSAHPQEGPRLLEFILLPWLCGVIILLITYLSEGASLPWVILPSLLICGFTVRCALDKYREGHQPLAIFFVLCCIGGFAAFIVSLITYVHFLQPYYELGSGATYLDMLPSQSAAAASDAKAIVFAAGTSVDTNRSYGYVDARQPSGTIYCVAPVSNRWTLREPNVDFFAAGTDCCGKRTGFGCGKGGAGSRGALMLAMEETANQGYKNAVEGAAAAYGIRPGNGYLLLTMVADPIAYRADKLDSAAKLMLIYALVYLLISCMTGFMAHSEAKK